MGIGPDQIGLRSREEEALNGHAPFENPWPEEEDARARFEFTPGGGFILDAPATVDALWGLGDDVLAASGEATMLAGVQGAGKSTIGQQFALGRCGFPEYATLFDFPIAPGRGRTLYLAMDRPRQISRSLRRMVGEAWREELDERLVVWKGPPPYDIAKHPSILRDMALEAGADTVVIDSLKDAAIGLNDDEVGAGYNRARQSALVAGVELLELHHGRKATNGTKRDRLAIDDVYGSTWLTSGAGSVFILSGHPGDPIVDLHHVKQPMNEVGPFKLLHDHEIGRTSLHNPTDLVALALSVGRVTAREAAEALFDTEKPTANEKEKARRRLEGLTREGKLRVLDEGNKATSSPRTWGAS